MNWRQLKDAGYCLSIGKRAWNLSWSKGRGPFINIANGRKRSATPRVTVEARAYPFAVADFVRRRVDDSTELTLADVVAIRDKAKKQLTEWFANRIDQLTVKTFKCPKSR